MTKRSNLDSETVLAVLRTTFHEKGDEIRNFFPETADKTDGQIFPSEIAALIEYFRGDQTLTWFQLSVVIRKALQDLANLDSSPNEYNPDVRILLDKKETTRVIEGLQEIR